jgi:hypothetical protein
MKSSEILTEKISPTPLFSIDLERFIRSKFAAPDIFVRFCLWAMLATEKPRKEDGNDRVSITAVAI